jgi:hypothetical protein
LIAWFRDRITFANVMSLTAVFIALGGTSYAVTQLDKNSVRSKHIRNGGVKRADLARNTVNSSRVRDRSLLARDFAAGQLPRGPQGERGPQGVQGPQGEPGPAGTFGSVTVQQEVASSALADGTSVSYDVTCPAGQQAVGGGARGDLTDSEYTIITSSRPLRAGGAFPTDGQDFIGWRATVLNPQGNPTTGGFPASPPDGDILPEVWAFCVPAP